MAGGRAQKLGPLELGEVMWCLLVTGHRTNGGAELREMYMRVGAARAGSFDSDTLQPPYMDMRACAYE